jgi:hypothetical protein
MHTIDARPRFGLDQEKLSAATEQARAEEKRLSVEAARSRVQHPVRSHQPTE